MLSSSKGNKRSLSTSKRQTQGKPAIKRLKRPGEIYLDTFKAPPGITNPANNCYCNALIQCLFNNPHFLSTLKAVFTGHPDHCDQQCCLSGNILCASPSTQNSYLLISDVKYHNSLGQICTIKALQRMLDDYTLHLNSKTALTSISPYPMLAALKGNYCHCLVHFPKLLYIIMSDISPTFVRGEQADSHELYLQLISSIKDKTFLKWERMLYIN